MNFSLNSNWDVDHGRKVFNPILTAEDRYSDIISNSNCRIFLTYNLVVVGVINNVGVIGIKNQVPEEQSNTNILRPPEY